MADINYDKKAEQYRKEAQDPYAGKVPSKQAQQEAADAAMRAKEDKAPTTKTTIGKKKGGVCCSASKRADGIAQRGKTRGRMV